MLTAWKFPGLIFLHILKLVGAVSMFRKARKGMSVDSIDVEIRANKSFVLSLLKATQVIIVCLVHTKDISILKAVVIVSLIERNVLPVVWVWARLDIL